MMKQKPESRGKSSEKMVKDIRRATGKRRSPEEKIRIVLDGLHGEESIADAVPSGRHCREPLLQLVEGVS